MSNPDPMASPQNDRQGSTTTGGFDFGFDDQPKLSDQATGVDRTSVTSRPASRIPSRPASQPLSWPASRPISRDEHVYTGGTSRRRASKFQSVSQSVRSAKTSSARPYFRSRRIRKGTIDRPELREKDPREIWITIIPLTGFVAGLAIIAVLAWSGYHSVVHHQYCHVFTDDFSNGFNTSIWTKQVETGGYSNGEFEITTGGDENVFVSDGKLIIKPTLFNETYLNQTAKTNLTYDGTCTANTAQACVLVANQTAGEIVMPVKSGRISTQNSFVIRYGRVDITARLAAGDWLLNEIMMFPAENYYGAWPASGEIDIAMVRGNNYTYDNGAGNQLLESALHWGPDSTTDRWQTTSGYRDALHAIYHDNFHTFGLEWTEKYLFTWVDSQLAQVMYIKYIPGGFFRLGGFGVTYENGSRIVDPWNGPGTGPATPFDRPFYLVLSLGVGGTDGWFPDGVGGKPWVDASTTARADFWAAREQWAPTWTEMVVKEVNMWQQCDNGATNLSAFTATS